MKYVKIFFGTIACLAMAIFMANINSVQSAQAADDTVSFTTNVLEYLAFSLTSGDTIAFGDLTPGTPICSTTETVATTTTNRTNGFSTKLNDGSDTNSAMQKASDYIPDMTGTLAVPASWVNSTTTGLGVTLFATSDASAHKEVKWGTGTTVCDANNKYAGIPASATEANNVNHYHSGAVTSTWGWKLDVANTQPSGSYSGSATFTVTGNVD